MVCAGACVAAAGVAAGFVFDAAIEAIRGEDNSITATAGNVTGGAAVALTSNTQKKPRGGIAGGGPSGGKTSVASKILFSLAQNRNITVPTEKLLRSALRTAPGLGVGLGVLELGAALNDRFNNSSNNSGNNSKKGSNTTCN